MKCVICGGNALTKTTEYREYGVLLGNFKAQICKKCGEIFFDEETAEKIQSKSKELGLFGLAKKAKVAEVGNSVAIRIPKGIASFVGLKKGKEVTITPESKHGFHIEV